MTTRGESERYDGGESGHPTSATATANSGVERPHQADSHNTPSDIMSLLLSNLKVQRAISRALCARMSSSIGGTFDSAGIVQHKLATKHACVLNNLPTSPSRRNLSTFEESSKSMRAFPQYSVFGEEAMLAMKVMPPQFRVVKNQILAMDATRKGRILLEFLPRGPDGKVMWTDVIRFGLAPEEVGLLVNQLPHYKVEFSRIQTQVGGDEAYGAAVSSDLPEKVLTVAPGELGAVNFTIDFVRDGVGGQSAGHGQNGKVRVR